MYAFPSLHPPFERGIRPRTPRAWIFSRPKPRRRPKRRRARRRSARGTSAPQSFLPPRSALNPQSYVITDVFGVRNSSKREEHDRKNIIRHPTSDAAT
jgi:hypothetical protein